MRFLGVASLVFLTAWAAAAQNESSPNPPPVLENSGSPISIPFHCTEDDIEFAGLSCSDQDPCPIYLELSAAEPVGDKIFLAGNLHSDAVTLYSVLLASSDEGKTWREVHERIRGAGLDHIQFLDFVNGWISGESLSPLPQDAFLLLTTDGGATWTREAVFAEPEPGSIQQFFFRSKDLGSMIIDRGEGSEEERYALYESPDGGRSWSLKQLSAKPLRLSRGAETEEAFRVRADQATQSFRIERRQGQRWIPSASFAVSAGFCKPPELRLPPSGPAAPEPSPEKAPN
jgi:hypothetical protein